MPLLYHFGRLSDTFFVRCCPYANYGLPGTGIYNRTKITGGSGGGIKSSNTNTSRQNQKQVANMEIKLHMDDNGAITFLYPDGRIITDESLIRKVKATPQYKSEKVRMQSEHVEEIAEQVKEFNDSVASLINIQKLSAKVDQRDAYINELNGLVLQTYSKVQFTLKAPILDDVRDQLFKEAEQNIKSVAFWTNKSKRDKYVNEKINERYNSLLSEWENQRSNFEKEQIELEKVQNEELKQQYSDKKSALEGAISGDDCYINIAIEDWLSSIELPIDFDVQFEYNSDKQSLNLDVDLPEIENIPNEKATQLANGNMKILKKTQNEIKDDYVTCVFGLAVFFASHLFNISPQISEVVLSGFTQRRDSKGNICDNYICSLKFTRGLFETTDLVNVNPYDFCSYFECRFILTATKQFKAIEPF